MKFKGLLASSILISSGLFASAAYADDFGCEALLCFAGGKNVSECQKTIKKVIKDMAKGKSFPHCSFVNGSGANESAAIGTRMFNEVSRKPICRDGQTRGIRSGVGGLYTCRTIEINVKPEYAADKSSQQQYFNW